MDHVEYVCQMIQVVKQQMAVTGLRLVIVPIGSIAASPLDQLRAQADKLRGPQVLVISWIEEPDIPDGLFDGLAEFHSWVAQQSPNETFAIVHIGQSEDQRRRFHEVLAKVKRRLALTVVDDQLVLLGNYNSIDPQILEVLEPLDEATVDQLAEPMADRLTKGSLGNALRALAEARILLRRKHRKSKHWYYSLPWRPGLQIGEESTNGHVRAS